MSKIIYLDKFYNITNNKIKTNTPLKDTFCEICIDCYHPLDEWESDWNSPLYQTESKGLIKKNDRYVDFIGDFICKECADFYKKEKSK